MNASRLGIKNIMMIWTVLIIIYLILNVLGGFSYGYPMGAPTPTVPWHQETVLRIKGGLALQIGRLCSIR
jgi:hypothetical protein